MYYSISHGSGQLPSLPSVEDFQDIIDQCAYIDYVMCCNRLPAAYHLPIPPSNCTCTSAGELQNRARGLYQSLSRKSKDGSVTYHEILVLQENVAVRALRLLAPVLFKDGNIPEIPRLEGSI